MNSLLVFYSRQPIFIIFIMANNPFTANEIEFFAEDEHLNIVPRFQNGKKMHFISGDYGPFETQVEVEVPVWLAISLKKRGKCNIKCPQWLEVEFLREVKTQEKATDVANLQPLPNHYMEIASLMFKYAHDDIEDCDRVRSLVEDIQNLRRHKLQTGLRGLGAAIVDSKSALYYVEMNNASAMEIHTIRDVFVKALESYHRLYECKNDATSSARRSTTSVLSSSPVYQDDLGAKKTLRRFRRPLRESQQTMTQDSNY